MRLDVSFFHVNDCHRSEGCQAEARDVRIDC